jgi:hypothetical protein
MLGRAQAGQRSCGRRLFVRGRYALGLTARGWKPPLATRRFMSIDWQSLIGNLRLKPRAVNVPLVQQALAAGTQRSIVRNATSGMSRFPNWDAVPEQHLARLEQEPIGIRTLAQEPGGSMRGARSSRGLHRASCGARVSKRSPTVDGSGCNCLNRNRWALNSAVECHPHTVEVVGSNPTAPTIPL